MTRVIVTRAAEQAGPLLEALERAGFEAFAVPLIETEQIDDAPIDVRDYDWVVVTSAAGADQLARRIRGTSRIAAIGEATAVVLRSHGFDVDFVPTRANQEALVAEFPRPVGRALFVGAEDARDVLATQLPADVRPVYRTRRLRPDALPAADVAIVASPSAAEALAEVTTDLPVVSIGPVTTNAARSVGLGVVAEAETQDVAGLIAAVRDAAG